MIYFTSMPQTFCHAVSVLMFFLCLWQLTLCLYQYNADKKWKVCRRNIVFFLLFLIFLSLLSASSEKETAPYHIPVPWIVIILMVGSGFVYTGMNFMREYKKNKKRLTLSSIREALNHLDTGVCFADDTGRILLINDVMNQLFFSLLGSYPQMLSEATRSLSDLAKADLPELYPFPDGTVWRIHTEQYPHPDMRDFTQTIAYNVTELYETNQKIQLENQKLDKTNKELKLMYERLADRIREQETLHLKMQIHNDIGTSLIAISNMIASKSDEHLEVQLRQLQNAVSYFSNNYFSTDELSYTVKRAEEMNVNVILQGIPPDNDAVCPLLADAISVSATNCARHAGGDRLLVQITGQNDDMAFTITNNGRAPEKKIIEGGGLTSLRKKAEQLGWTMDIDYVPEFKLTIKHT